MWSESHTAHRGKSEEVWPPVRHCRLRPHTTRHVGLPPCVRAGSTGLGVSAGAAAAGVSVGAAGGLAPREQAGGSSSSGGVRGGAGEQESKRLVGWMLKARNVHARPASSTPPVLKSGLSTGARFA